MTWLYFPIFHILTVVFNDMAGKVFDFEEKTTVDILREASYPVETHFVNTDDGYILTMHRIPCSDNFQGASKGPVFLMHGLLSSSADWIVTEEKSLGFALAEAGYDVWMGNNRGNTYSARNTNWDALLDSRTFFDYSYHELGKYDLPAMIDYVLNATNKTKIPYVGFSEGTTQFFVMMSERPEYNSKISIMNSWAPVTNMYRIENKLINLLAEYPVVEEVAQTIGWYELFSHRKVGNIFRAVCWIADSYSSWIFNLIGSSWDRIPNKDLKVKISHNFPAGMSLKQVSHYVQGARSGVFRPFDYGTEQNMLIYHKDMPDPYNISAVTVPVVLFYGDCDIFVNNEVMLNSVAKELKNVKKILLPNKNFNHLDFIWSTDVDWLINETLSHLAGISEADELVPEHLSSNTSNILELRTN